MLQKFYHQFLFLLFSMCYYGINWCDKKRFLHLFTYHLSESRLKFAAPTCNCCNLQKRLTHWQKCPKNSQIQQKLYGVYLCPSAQGNWSSGVNNSSLRTQKGVF